MSNEAQSLLAWQWSGYPERHRDRRNLTLHALTNPLFLFGNLSLPAAVLSDWRLLPGGLGLMVLAMALQGRGHKLELTPPDAFRGAFDVVARIFCEQWITFPRYVLSGGFARAWRGSSGAVTP